MREHPDTFKAGNLITLEGPSGNTWKVRASDKPIIHSGWRAFSYDHDLTEGDQLCFNLTQPGHFVVDILDANGEVKGSALSATNTGKYTVASINNPCEYVRRSRKRRNTTSPIMKTPRRSRAGFGYGVHGPTIASRCKTTARRRNSNDYPLGTRLRASDKAKLWVCHEEMDGREVVTILDSDDEAAEEDNRLLDSIDLSFGSAQVQRYRVSKIQRVLEYMKSQGEYVPQWSIPSPQVALAGEDQRMVAAARESEKISHQEIAGQGEEKVAGAAEPIVSEGAMTGGRTAESQVKKARMEKSDSGIVSLPCQAQASCDEDMTMSKEEDKTHLEVYVEVGNNLESVHCADLEALQSHKIPSPSQEGGATEQELHMTVGFLGTKEADLPANPSQELLTSSAAMSEKTQAEAGGEFLFATLQNIVDMPVIADTTNGGQSRDSVHPLMRDLITQELAQKNFDTQVENELHFKKNKDPENEVSMLQSSSASKGHRSSEFPTAKVPPGYGCGASEPAEEDEIMLQYLHFLQPPKAMVGHPRRHLEFKQFLHNIVTDSDIRTPKTPDPSREKRILQAARNPPLSVKEHTSAEICVLESKRGRVGSLDREKTLKAAQTWTKKLRNPNFVAVMQTSNVYYDFIMVTDACNMRPSIPCMYPKGIGRFMTWWNINPKFCRTYLASSRRSLACPQQRQRRC